MPSMSIAQKLRRKNKQSEPATSRPKRMRVSAWIGWLPLLGVVLCTATLGLLIHQLIEQGRLEGSVALSSGQYIEAELTSGEIRGHLLPPAPKIAANAISGALQASILDSSGSVRVDDNAVKLRSAPNMALVENSEYGLLPVIGPDGMTALQYYGRPFIKKGNVSLISVVVTGLGINKEMSIAASRLPADICLSVSPYASDVPVWMQSMRVQGHEFLLDLPLEPSNFPLSDPGPQALMTNIMPEENEIRLKKILASSTGYVGMVASSDEVFFQGEKDFIEPVVKEFATRGILTIFTKFQERPVLEKIADEAKLANLAADVNIRYGADINEIVQQFSGAETIASKSGAALVVIQASPVAIVELEKWIKTLDEKGFQLTPVSVLAR